MLQRICYCYLRYHLVTAYYVTIVRLTAWPICGVIMHFSQRKDVPHKVEYLFGKNGHSWGVFCSGSMTIWLIMALK